MQHYVFRGEWRMDLFYDLHIHSCLSPCGSDDMTPANLVGMAYVKGLDVIAITDHNSCLNCKAVLHAAQEYGIVAIPGMELTTIEEVHVLCLFPNLNQAMKFHEYVKGTRLLRKNVPDLFGNQLIYNEQDQCIGEEENLLILSTSIPFLKVQEIVEQYDGIMIPAHVDKDSFSLLSNLGVVPEDSKFYCVEFARKEKEEQICKEHPYLASCKKVYNSDAHMLPNIMEPLHTISVTDRTISAIWKAFRE